MAYRLENGEPVADGLRRCAREQVDTAIEELTDGVTEDAVSAVHDARKALKKERSLLRLGRAALDSSERRSEADAFRDVAQRLGGMRDSDVMIEALDDLADRFAGHVPKRSFTAIRRFLVARRDRERQELTESAVIGEAVGDLQSARLRIADWRIRADGWSTVSDGLLRSYRRGRRAFEIARAEPSSENLHAWRKRVKDIWYHFRVLTPIAPHSVKGQTDEAHRLSDVLGDDHDLAVLRATLLRSRGEIKADVDPVIALIGHRRAQLQTEAFFLGERLYAERPKAFRRRMRRYWHAWRAETSAIDAQRPAASTDAADTSALT